MDVNAARKKIIAKKNKIMAEYPLCFIEKYPVLPYELDETEKEILQKFGIVIGDVIKEIQYPRGNPLFRFAEFPEGWWKEETPNGENIVLKDESGADRVIIYCDISFLGIDFSLQIVPRFFACAYPDGDGMYGQILDNATQEVIFKTKTYKRFGKMTFLKLEEKIGKELEKWLKRYYPLWENPGAYWDYSRNLPRT